MFRTAFQVDRLILRDAVEPRAEFLVRVELANFLQHAHKGRLRDVFGDVAVSDATEKVTRQIRSMTAIQFVEATAIGENSVFDQKLFVGVIVKIVNARNGGEGDVHSNLRGAAALGRRRVQKTRRPANRAKGVYNGNDLRKKVNLSNFDDFNELFPKTPPIGGKSPSKPEENLTKIFKNVANNDYCNRRGGK
jgi:hypothetical protein